MSIKYEVGEFQGYDILTTKCMNEIVERVNIWSEIKDVKVVSSEPANFESDVLYLVLE